ncbi:endonuclease/exonuclease/phosphatase family protein [Paenibacillus ginsengarvi]|uniref:Endonuclease/exonuclease/phosphatase family protein n=1 Tax=Paenibacillus ginsengarvi TaxID=400777 RepID=A0A3B0BR00_9BACL|nr:endonuclease/exonuclease/phosphatase family protein [Paenibacillus ginsengarvi]RKN74126.1 endonuclease/exonuclease/phosphatase family protein [Paenibacillus ginsengarvi]
MEQSFKVMTFNLRINAAQDPYSWEQRKFWATAVIEEQKPDLIGAQEVTIPMLGWLADRFRDRYDLYAVNRKQSNDSGEHCAILVKKETFSIVHKSSFMLSETPDVIGSFGWDAACERICSWVELAGRHDGTPMLRFYNTHLDHRGDLARKEGLRLVLTEMERQTEALPAILTGDFNAGPENELFRVMAGFAPMSGCFDSWSEEEQRRSKTFHGYKGGEEGSPIDYIFASEGLAIESTEIIRDRFDGGYPSDHYPVVSTIRRKVGATHEL